MNEINVAQCEDDVIDLRELWRTIIKHKNFIIIFTLSITAIAAIWAFIKTPIYEVKSNLQIGFIGKDLIANPGTLVKTANLVFNVGEKITTKKPFVSKVSSITVNKKIKNFVEIKTEAISNKKALAKNKEVVSYIQNKYKNIIYQYQAETNNKIKAIDIDISRLENLEKNNLQQQIKLLKTQKIVEIDEKIKFLKKIKLNSLKNKIKFYSNKLVKYEKSIKQIYQYNKQNNNTTTLTISSIQMVNYQNLILNSQNKIEDLNTEIEKIRTETIPNLERKKENINNITIRKLLYKLNVELPNKISTLNEKIKQLKFNISTSNMKNSQVVGNYIIHDYPAKPKKKLIIVVAFATGFILAIFIVFFLEFIKSTKEEDETFN